MLRTKKKNLRDHASDLADLVAPHVESAREKAGPALAEARGKAGPLLADAREKAAPLLAEAREKAAPLVSEAREKAAPYVTEAREKAGPALAEARERFAAEVVPAVAAALASLDEATEEVRGETKRRGKAVAAALKGEIEAPKKTHKLRTTLVVLGLGGIAATVAKKLSDRKATTAWQSSYTPTPAAPSTANGAHRADAAPVDEGGASPDVAVADNAAEPHAATTPDNPAVEVDVTDK
jgi:vacuolar-type H+-ATPase subunit H